MAWLPVKDIDGTDVVLNTDNILSIKAASDASTTISFVNGSNMSVKDSYWGLMRKQLRLELKLEQKRAEERSAQLRSLPI